jgi:hypothetical protein
MRSGSGSSCGLVVFGVCLLARFPTTGSAAIRDIHSDLMDHLEKAEARLSGRVTRVNASAALVYDIFSAQDSRSQYELTRTLVAGNVTNSSTIIASNSSTAAVASATTAPALLGGSGGNGSAEASTVVSCFTGRASDVDSGALEEPTACPANTSGCILRAQSACQSRTRANTHARTHLIQIWRPRFGMFLCAFRAALVPTDARVCARARALASKAGVCTRSNSCVHAQSRMQASCTCARGRARW